MPLSAAHSRASRPAIAGLSGLVGGRRPVAVRQVASSARAVATPASRAEVEPSSFHACFPFGLSFLDFSFGCSAALDFLATP